MTDDDVLAFYAKPGVFTGVEGFEHQVAALPSEPAVIAAVVQGLLLPEAWAPAYGIAIAPDRIAEKQLHSARAMLACAQRHDARSVDQARIPQHRVIGVCRHFATLFVALMRHKGIPCRARCGFANYFQAGENLDHWVGEYWNAQDGRWVLVDAQLDTLQRKAVRIAFDPLDVPRDRFLVAGDAWLACRNGADPNSFGVGGTDMWGLVEVYGDLFQDLAALQNIELLPWGWYGLAEDKQGMQETQLIDRLAAISSKADAAAIDALHALLDRDARLRVPTATVKAIIAAEQTPPPIT